MSKLAAITSGNFTDSSIWGVIDATSQQLTIFTSTTLTTSYLASSIFTPGAIVVDAIAVYIWGRVTSPGSTTLSVAILQGGSVVTGTEVTTLVSNLSNYSTSGTKKIGWVWFKLDAPITLSAATDYTVGLKTSGSNLVTVMRDSASNNWARLLRTTTTQAPIAGDDTYIYGNATNSSYTAVTPIVTINTNTTTAYGNIEIGQRGVLAFATSTSATYNFRVAGNITVTTDGTFKVGDATTPLPNSSTATLEFACTSVNQYGIYALNNGALNFAAATWSTIGTLLIDDNDDPKIYTSGNNTFSIYDDVGTGTWKAGDEVLFFANIRSRTAYEVKTISSLDSYSLITTATTTRSYNGDIYNLSRRVKVKSINSSYSYFIRLDDVATIFAESATFYHLGIGFSTPNSLYSNSTGTCTLQNCVLRDGGDIFNTSSLATNITLTSCIFYNASRTALTVSTITTLSGATINYCYVFVADTGYSVNLGTVFNSYAFGCSIGTYIATNSNFKDVNSFASLGSSCVSGTLIGTDIRNGKLNINGNFNTSCAGRFETNFYANDLVIKSNARGNADAHFLLGSQGRVLGNICFKNCEWLGGYTVDIDSGSDSGLKIGSNMVEISIADSFIGGNTAGLSDFYQPRKHNLADINFISENPYKVKMYGTELRSTTKILNSFYLTYGGFISQERILVDGSNLGGLLTNAYGTVKSDFSIYNVATPSIRLTPISATDKLRSNLFLVPSPDSGVFTVKVKVRTSSSGDGAQYNGNSPRLVLIRSHFDPNYGDWAGVTDTNPIVLATISPAYGVWSSLFYTFPSYIYNWMYALAVDCDGTQGWVNIDDLEIVYTTTTGVKHDAGAFQYWYDGQPIAFSNSNNQNITLIQRIRKVR